MSYPHVDANEPPLHAPLPARPVEVLCPSQRPLSEIMKSFREQRRLEQAEGETGAVIRRILEKSGRRSLAADLLDAPTEGQQPSSAAGG